MNTKATSTPQSIINGENDKFIDVACNSALGCEGKSPYIPQLYLDEEVFCKTPRITRTVIEQGPPMLSNKKHNQYSSCQLSKERTLSTTGIMMQRKCMLLVVVIALMLNDKR